MLRVCYEEGLPERQMVAEWKITDIEQIEDKRPMNREMHAVYILSPQPHIVDCLMADFESRRYRGSYIIWTSCQHPRSDLHRLMLCIHSALMVTKLSASSPTTSTTGAIHYGKGTNASAPGAQHRLFPSRVSSDYLSRPLELPHSVSPSM